MIITRDIYSVKDKVQLKLFFHANYVASYSQILPLQGQTAQLQLQTLSLELLLAATSMA
jgi:hypothetical protein